MPPPKETASRYVTRNARLLTNQIVAMGQSKHFSREMQACRFQESEHLGKDNTQAVLAVRTDEGGFDVAKIAVLTPRRGWARIWQTTARIQVERIDAAGNVTPLENTVEAVQTARQIVRRAREVTPPSPSLVDTEPFASWPVVRLGPETDEDIQGVLDRQRAGKVLPLSPEEMAHYDGLIKTRAQGIIGASRVLNDILVKYGPEVFLRVAPRLGTGSEVWVKFKRECHYDLAALIATCGSPEDE